MGIQASGQRVSGEKSLRVDVHVRPACNILVSCQSWNVGSRVDMHVRTVRMEESRSLAPSSPHAARIYESIILGQYASDCIQTSRDRFFQGGENDP
jgi:hypothetical protein